MMKKISFRNFITTLLVTGCVFSFFLVQRLDQSNINVSADAVPGALKVDTANPHYFIDANGKRVFLLGSTAYKFSNMNVSDQEIYSEIDVLLGSSSTTDDDMNYLRIWNLRPWDAKGDVRFPWLQTGASYSSDYKFDLTRWDETYWSRMKKMVSYAQSRGVYVNIFPFDECGMEGSLDGKEEMWKRHPYHPYNNSNNLGLLTNTATPIDGSNSIYDPWGNGKLNTLETVQKAYFTKLLNELAPYNNVMFEVVNEYQRGGETWEAQVADYLKTGMESRNQTNSTYWKTQIVTVNHILAAEAHDYQWTDPNIAGYNFHKTINKSDGKYLANAKINALAEYMSSYYSKNKVINCNECSHLSKYIDMRKIGMGMFVLGGYVSFDDSTDAITPVANKIHKFIRGVTVPGDSRKGVKFWEMKPNNTYFRAVGSSVYIKSTPSGSSTGYTLANPGREYVVFLDGYGSSNGVLGIDLSGLPTGMEYKAVAYNTDPAVTTNEYTNLSVSYNGVSSQINGIPSFGSSSLSSSQVVYIRAIQVDQAYQTSIINETTLQVKSSEPEPFALTHLQQGSQVYTDRDQYNYSITTIPAELSGLNTDWINTANNDKSNVTNPFITFQVKTAGYVYIIYDVNQSPPAWLAGWELRTDRFARNSTSGSPTEYKLFRKYFANGSNVSLGPNVSSGTGSNMYLVAAYPAAQPNIKITKTILSNSVSVGDNIEYTLLIKNEGVAPALNINVSDPIDLNKVRFKSADNNGSYDATNKVVKWSISKLEAGQVISLKLVVTTDLQPSVTLVGAGDIAYSGYVMDKTANLIDNISGTVFTAGDNNQSNTADYATKMQEYVNYFTPTWGRFINRLKPAMGNHDYLNPGAYYDYFGSAAGPVNKGYYSYNLGAWHIIVLNSNIEQSQGSTQEQWLKNDLANNTNLCTMAIWHHPRFSSGVHGNNSNVGTFWQDLYSAGAEVVVNGHDHDYERFAPQKPDQTRDDASGIREFVAGTGGAPNRSFGTIQSNSEVRKLNHGVLKFDLYSNKYDWQFIHIDDGAVYDSGTTNCH